MLPGRALLPLQPSHRSGSNETRCCYGLRFGLLFARAPWLQLPFVPPALDFITRDEPDARTRVDATQRSTTEALLDTPDREPQRVRSLSDGQHLAFSFQLHRTSLVRGHSIAGIALPHFVL